MKFKMRHRSIEKEELVKQKTIGLLVNEGFESFSVNKLARACGISIATLYIYYKDKDDLIIQIAREEVKKMKDAVAKDFNPEVNFEEGLRLQWKNRFNYLMANPVLPLFFELLRASSYQDKIYTGLRDDQDDTMRCFMQNCMKRGEIPAMPVELYWSVAVAPLQSLIRAHYEGIHRDGHPFKLNETIVWQAFQLLVKALKIN